MVASPDLSTMFADCSYTFDWVIQTLEANDSDFKAKHQIAKVTKIDYREIGCGEGFISKVFKVDISFDAGNEPYSVVLKVPCPTNSAKKVIESLGRKRTASPMQIIASLHKTECRFYNEFKDLGVLPIAKIYAAEDVGFNGNDGAILMEYLATGGVNQRKTKSFTEGQVFSISKFLAKLIAESLSAKKFLQGTIPYPEKLYKKMLEVGRASVKKCIQERSSFFGPSIYRIAHLMENDDFCDYTQKTLNNSLGLKSVLSHGDMWTNNILWKKLENGKCGDEIYAVLDFQLLHFGTVARDLSLILVLGTDAGVRRNFEKTGLQCFFSMLEKELKNRKQTIPFTLAQIRACYKAEFIRSLILSFTYVYALIAGNSCPENDAKLKAEQDGVWLRIKYAVEDGLKILEEDMPEWLGKNDLSLEMEMPKWLDEDIMSKPITESRSRQPSLCQA